MQNTEISGACSTYGGEERCLQGYNWVTCGRYHLQDLAVDDDGNDDNNNNNRSFKKWDGEHGLD